jgi:hypothetical protein
VPVHDNFAEVILAQQKLLPNPEEIAFGLFGEANSWSNTGMHRRNHRKRNIALGSQEFTMARGKNSVKVGSKFTPVLGVGFDLRDQSI